MDEDLPLVPHGNLYNSLHQHSSIVASNPDQPPLLLRGHVDDPWVHFEVARRDANFHIREYLRCLKASTNNKTGTTRADPACRELSTSERQTTDANYWGMKVARDNLIKDLTNTMTWLAEMEQSQARVTGPVSATFVSGMGFAALQQPWFSTLPPFGLILGKVVTGAILASIGCLQFIEDGAIWNNIFLQAINLVRVWRLYIPGDWMKIMSGI